MLWQALAEVVGRCVPWAIDANAQEVVIAGQGAISESEFVVIAFDSHNGALLWKSRSRRPASFSTAATAVSIEQRRAYVSAWTTASAGLSDEMFVVRSYDTRTGDVRWEDILEDTVTVGIFQWHALDVEASKNRVYAVGLEGHGDWVVRAYDTAAGDVLWEDRFQPDGRGASYGWTQGLVLDGGRLFVVGPGVNANGNVDLILRAYDAK